MIKAFRLLFLMAMGTALVLTACDRETAEWVDLGLPSGLMWATCNLGATTPEDYGDYYAWGEVDTKEVYSWSTYKYCNGNYNQLTKYCMNPDFGHGGFTDSLATIETRDDMAAQKIGAGAHVPTTAEWEELLAYTTAERITMKGVSGLRLTSRTNGNRLFLPAAGYRWGSELRGARAGGDYWCSSIHADFPSRAWSFSFLADDQRMRRKLLSRCRGRSVRPVRSAR